MHERPAVCHSILLARHLIPHAIGVDIIDLPTAKDEGRKRSQGKIKQARKMIASTNRDVRQCDTGRTLPAGPGRPRAPFRLRHTNIRLCMVRLRYILRDTFIGEVLGEQHGVGVRLSLVGQRFVRKFAFFRQNLLALSGASAHDSAIWPITLLCFSSVPSSSTEKM
ncbi:hypothetical protein IE81DRAFT_99217 [Ceraceosorus guamensis]|uniref:Uncharacterized protein n=1 Tax=Ceraceosorus guamensis TaxID=1522189 RepID=A0A316W3J8_9BASI|nr:hypothetical protein IE81DRAFT_99217 [Ceraceosorus guamensis]PWN43181.1 hypothetical protein IE81DRAFT_99217 [Ceraceosorus guamensis]